MSIALEQRLRERDGFERERGRDCMREIDGFERDLQIERERGRDGVRERERDGFERERGLREIRGSWLQRSEVEEIRFALD